MSAIILLKNLWKTLLKNSWKAEGHYFTQKLLENGVLLFTPNVRFENSFQ